MVEVIETPDFWVAVGFLIFLAIVFKPALNLINEKLDNRAGKITEAIVRAEKLREEAQHLLADHQRKQSEASKETEALVATARVEAEKAVIEANEAFSFIVIRREQQMQDKIARIEAESKSMVRDYAVDIAVEATINLLANRIGEKQSIFLIDQAISNLQKDLNFSSS